MKKLLRSFTSLFERDAVMFILGAITGALLTLAIVGRHLVSTL